ncbi:peptidylprolyl isomerase [Marinihelvus fidelis]|uniref:peptidylprolyl isomerase n=1 Tax=Marinihelvus fidelis TaxID=2613842 RepID=A0A5N0T8R3_9GAMM|nr:peptidylprolyl isomerase [Marinihelvus fidelis]KAA9131423.1 peptidylprolyl isomerase [Marinihelvus fidelis]
MRHRLALALFLAALAVMPAAAQDEPTWRRVDPANLVFIGMNEGQVVLELNPAFAPETTARFRTLVESDFYRGLSFYRVIDGFVAQAGDESDISGETPDKGLPPEFEREFDPDLPWTPVQKPDLFAPETGFSDGFAVGRDGKTVWLSHCPGAVAMARGNEPNSGQTDFYIVIGQAPRYLDRNLTIFARVIDGMDVVQKIQRGDRDENGIITNELARSRIGRMRMGYQLEEDERLEYYVMNTADAAFRDYVESRRDRRHEFFDHRPPKVLDVCQVPIPSRAEKVSVLSRRVQP